MKREANSMNPLPTSGPVNAAPGGRRGGPRFMLAVAGSVLLAGLVMTVRAQDFAEMFAVMDKVAAEIKGKSLQEAKNTVIQRFDALPKMTSADLRGIRFDDGTYAVEYHRVRTHGGIVVFKDVSNGRKVGLNAHAQANTATKAVLGLDFGKSTLQEAKQKIEALHEIPGVVLADFTTARIADNNYGLRYCLDDKHGGLVLIRDSAHGREVALRAGADADQALNIVNGLKFDGLTLAQAEELINAQSFATLGVVYANFGGRDFAGKWQVLRFPFGEISDASCAL